ncbi:hypothetical protein ES703_105767 [subsurface metagenome]
MKKVIIFTLIVVLILVLTPSIIYAKNGPAKKATGSISIFEKWDGGHREIEFNTHEAKDGRDAKGKMVDNVYGPDGVLRRVFKYDVKYVRVDDDYAYFGALCTYDSEAGKTGKWLYVKVYDGGTPGTIDDHIGWKWASDETEVASWVNSGAIPGWWRMATEGNLVVHTYD